MSDNIKVVVKVRPLISREIEQKLSYQWRVKNNTLYQLDHNGKDFGASFTFDKVYDKDTETQEVYNDIAKPIVEAAAAGFNGTIFAYGQTSSGKTYTMTGTEESPGIIPLAVLNLYDIIKNVPNRDFLVRVSYIEIYNESLKDLLNVENKEIRIRDTFQGVKVESTEKVTSTPEEVFEAMKMGEANRQTGATYMNEESSRSHSIFQITIESREHIEGEEEVGSVNVSQLNLVDLAGSERSGQTGATGIRFKEGTHINKSLSALALVMKQLSEDPNKHVNYRDSKLTRILQNSLGGNAKTSIICAVTPASVEETISTLQFANRAKIIKNKPEVNAVATDATMIQSLTKQLSRLQSQLESKKNIEQDNFNLQKQIAALQKLILNGFGQRSRMDIIGNSRRKLQPPRRVTISTLHLQPIEEDHVPIVPKFCTPSLKYNPMALAGSTEFLPIQNANKLPSLPEETRLVTPPPIGGKTNMNDEIINLDSDEDETSKIQTCSPYHKCYDSSKTPPCILRKTAEQAEKNFKDIVKLTNREKIYTPSVVELMEQLDQNKNVISRLQEEVDSLTKESKDKDLKLEELKKKVYKTEDEVKIISSAKIDLEEMCKGYKTKLTDWEVSYETLKKKAKNREDELLSLLEEQKIVLNKGTPDLKNNEPRTIEKELLNFMDLSKDLSLVNSDNEVNVSISNEDNSTTLKDLVTEMQAQISTKNQAILDLEANILAQKLKIEGLEMSSQELQGIVDSIKDKLTFVEGENSLLRSTIETLNTTIKNQKSHLETANNDIKSYNSLIQELQIKLIKKDNILNVKINDQLLENMIANEDKFISNNENMKNIIQCFRLALSSRNKEIDSLKSTVNSYSDISSGNSILKEQVEKKDKQINNLIEEAERLKNQLDENALVVKKLLQVEKEISDKLTTLQEHNNTLQNENKEKTFEINNLKEHNEKFVSCIYEKEALELEMLNKNEDLTKKIRDMSTKIDDLMKDIKQKDELISSLINVDKETKSNLIKAKLALNKMHQILITFNKEDHEIPDINDYDKFFDALDSILTTLETTAIAVAKEIKQTYHKAEEDKCDNLATIQKLETELNILKAQVEVASKERDEIIDENNRLSRQITDIRDALTTMQKDLDFKNHNIIDIETKLYECEENNEKLRLELSSKDNILSSLQETITSLCSEKEKFLKDLELYGHYEKEINELKTKMQTKQNEFDQILKKKDTEIDNLSNRIEEMGSIIGSKQDEIKELKNEINYFIESRDKELQEILNITSKLTSDFNIKDLSDSLDNSAAISYEQIILTLNKVVNHISFTNSENYNESSNIKDLLSNAKLQINELTQQNIELLSNYSEIEDKNQKLLEEIEKIRIINKNLSGSSKLLDELKTELIVKAKEIECMELKARELKSQFTEFEYLMKQQMDELQNENFKLLERIAIIEKRPFNQSTDLESYSECQQPNIGRRSLCVLEDKKKEVFNLPQRLSTICCNRMLEILQLNDADYNSLTTTSSKSCIEVQNVEIQVGICECIKLSQDLEATKAENLRLNVRLLELESENQHMVKEQEAVRKEVQLLLEPANELKKKLYGHRTNLSTLTATTYAENKLLHSQLKVLKHHHTRYIHVCQKDLPGFKSQLHELMTILKGSSVIDKQNTSLKRYSLPDVLDNNSTLNNLKNESTLDGDLLMLDTNITLTTSADNTLIGHDQTSLDVTQINFDNEVACQTGDSSKVLDSYFLYSQMETLSSYNQKITEELNFLKDENQKLREQVDEYTNIKFADQTIDEKGNCENCRYNKELKLNQERFALEIQTLSQELSCVKTLKEQIEEKYNNLTLEIPSTDALVRKMNILEKEHDNKIQEITKIISELNKKNKLIKDLQDENDALSTQVIENISEVDDLKKELDTLKQLNTEVSLKYNEQLAKENYETKSNDSLNCTQCAYKDELLNSLQSKQILETHSKLNRSLSDSESSSRYNKICTLQNELHASKEDCKKITEEVATIKNQLESSNLSMSQNMDLDESINDANIFAFTKDIDAIAHQVSKFNMPHIREEGPCDIYTLDKVECINYYVETTGADKDPLDNNIKIIDVMKKLYNFLIVKHGNEVDNLVNKLVDFEESKRQLLSQIENVTTKTLKLTKELEDKDKNLNNITNIFSNIRKNLNSIDQNIDDANKTDKIITEFKENVLKILDEELGLSSKNVFESLLNNMLHKYQENLKEVMDRYAQLQTQMENVQIEFDAITNNLNEMKSQLSNKENEYSLLKAQKEKVHEICNAVTLDIIKKEQELNQTISEGYEKMLELNIISPGVIDLTISPNQNVRLLFEYLVNQIKSKGMSEKQNEDLIFKINKSTTIIQEKDKELEEMKAAVAELEKNLNSQKSLHEHLNKIYRSKVDENEANLSVIETLNDEIKILKQTIQNKQVDIVSLENEIVQRKNNIKALENNIAELNSQTQDLIIENTNLKSAVGSLENEINLRQNDVIEKENNFMELMQKINDLMKENQSLKSLNDITMKEKQLYAKELDKSCEIINENKIELDKMTSDIIGLRKSIKDNVAVIETLKEEAKSLLQHNLQLKDEFENKCQECSRLEVNIKTHEKTAEIQSKMIIRLQKQKDESDKLAIEKAKEIEELTHNYATLQKEYEEIKISMKHSKKEINELMSLKETLETRESALETGVEGDQRHRLSIEAMAESSRRRRQSIYDSKRMFAEDKDFDGHGKMEEMFGSRPKPDDLFMDVDDDSSNRSTPNRLSRRRDSFGCRGDQDDKEEEYPSRPSSVMATRRRRQSIHDFHRNSLQGHSSLRPTEDQTNLPINSSNNSQDSEVHQLRERLISCQQELEELKERYRELDDECETCAQYLRERDEQCARLKKEKAALENEVKGLNEKLKSSDNNRFESKANFAHASVNTDEDWANLHSVVVDRMSFDAEVEKNKKLHKTIEELRYKKQELKNTLTKMQKALEKYSSNKENRELEITKSELKACKQELAELKQRYKDLDEECETCAEYLKEREEQCRKLREAKAALEAKLHELQENSSISQSTRKKRQSIHDQNRSPAPNSTDAATETSEDLLSYLVERDNSGQKSVETVQTREIKSLKVALDKLTKEKAALELASAQMAAVPPALPTMYVATGSAIVQNQQITDVLKENQKLKKLNAKLIQICKKRGKALHDSNRENEELDRAS